MRSIAWLHAAPQSPDRHERRLWYGPGLAAHHAEEGVLRSIRGTPRFTTHSTLTCQRLVFDIAVGKRIGEKNPVFPAATDPSIMISDSIRAVILGVVEGVTEFLPVSSTGHLLLAERFFDLGEDNFWKSFAVLIQLGAILAIVAIYFGKLWRIALGMFSNPDDRRFVIGVLVAFLPAAVIGAAAGGYIKGYLFNPWVVCFSLIVGGAILLWVDQLDLEPHEHDATTFPLPMYLKIGFAQCLAMIPGVSRSGASIVAAMLLGADKRAAAEFSFFLAIPTMFGAFVYDLYKNRADMSADHVGIVAIGFVVSFVTAIIVVKTFLNYVTRHGFTLFAWWRVIVGTIGLIALALGR
jgi:undecaprenyl-diphosphatase